MKKEIIMTDESDIDKILKAVGKPVKFKYPPPEGYKVGILKERSVIPSTNKENEVPYWSVVDLIEFPVKEEAVRKRIRIGYYRKPKDRLVWASQTTAASPIHIWKRILTQAAKEKSWFRDLLLEVVMELDK
jgi:hypothetical protein